ncbi:protein strubbelig-receptor family 5 [Gossypium arboreum]|uniref:Protein strubbelig-receptor family 5 n=1 Tax=Gossypium arboreum TaxID=29729 RepID=A0A0B0N8D5_GOSAR|nr:protein strubbelig-receptor family 5 [Gossypium arboreum]
MKSGFITLGSQPSLKGMASHTFGVNALNVMFKSLKAPSQLSGWRVSGGDPCSDSWQGVKCSGSRVTEISLSNYGLNGELGYQLSNLTSLTSLDVSKNNLNDQIPYQLPPNAVRINLSNNKLDGTLSDMFAKVKKLKSLRLQNNQLTGTLNVLADLPIEDLNVENNKFSGWIPNELKGIRSLKTGGNSWSTGKAPPPPPGVRHRHPNAKDQDNKDDGEKSKLVRNVAIVAGSCLGAMLVFAALMAVFARRKAAHPSSQFLDEERNTGTKDNTPFQSRELAGAQYVSNVKESKGLKTIQSGVTLDQASLQISGPMGLNRSVSGRGSSVSEQTSRLKGRSSTSAPVIAYSLEDLQNATSDFASRNLQGEGNIGRVYRAKCEDGKVLAVKKIDPILIQGEKPEGFAEIVANISKLHHPNIAELVGYCSEQGNYLLVYDHYRNGSLHEFLHVSDDFSKPLTWNTRVSIALGAARAVEYLHDVCSPPIVHKNIKSSNILLDLELTPHLSDYGMAHFHQRTSQNLGMGYNAPECARPSAYTLKSDVYSFGVVMLELLTGRMPLDNKRPKAEQCLVKWASPRLQDNGALAAMVDPALRGLYPPKSLSPFADIIAHCSDPKLRPAMSEVVQSLIQLVQQSNMNLGDDLSTSRRTEDSDYAVYV